MENQTRFDLNAAIENWRQELAAQPDLASDDRRELETHLRDAIAEFRQRGLNDEESFWLAHRRVGQPQQLGEEFVKADPANVWRERIFWMWLALFLSSTLGSVGRSVALAVMPANIHSNAFPMWQITEIALLLLSILIPLVLAILLAKGKLIPQFSRLMLLTGNRRRLAIAAFVCIFLSSTIRFISVYSRFHAAVLVIGQSIAPVSYALIAGVILVWLMPAQNWKTPKRL